MSDRTPVGLGLILMAVRPLFAQIKGYQEQPYLLDPYLEEMVLPIIETLKSHVKVLAAADPEDVRVTFRFASVCSLLYTFVKFRGYKAIGMHRLSYPAVSDGRD